MFILNVRLPDTTRQIEVPEGPQPSLLTDVLRHAGLPLNTRCGQRGLCEGCMVELLSGRLVDATNGQVVELFKDKTNGVGGSEIAPTLRGCELELPQTGCAEIAIPARSLLAHQPQVVTSFRLNVPRAHDPVWQRLVVRPEAPGSRDTVRPTAGNDRPLPQSSSPAIPGGRGEDTETTESADRLGKWLRSAVALRLESDLPIELDFDANELRVNQAGDYEVAVEHLGDRRAIRLPLTCDGAYGAAVDIGTTTVVVVIVELATGRVVGNASALNAQARLGDNVLTRINLCMNEPRMVERLQRAVIRGTLLPLLRDAVREAGLLMSQLTCMVVAGNTTMLYLMRGVDPRSLGVAPFTAEFLDHRAIPAGELPWQAKGKAKVSAEQVTSTPVEAAGQGGLHPSMTVHLLPGAAAYVGADITSGVLASGMAYRNETSLLVDLGTNGEIVLRHDKGMVGCATAAGPAFEGAGLSYGMRAGHGAVGHIWLEEGQERPRIEVIGGGKPVGLCGTAYIDFVARARKMGLLTPTARLVAETGPGIVRHKTHGLAFVVSDAEGEEPLLITEADMASLLQAKAAIAAGITCLLNQAELQPSDVGTVYLAGGFGFHMHVDTLLGCGMLPGFQADQIELVGNTSLAGAYLTMLDSQALRELRNLAEQLEVVELNLDPAFELTYIDQLTLP